MTQKRIDFTIYRYILPSVYAIGVRAVTMRTIYTNNRSTELPKSLHFRSYKNRVIRFSSMLARIPSNRKLSLRGEEHLRLNSSRKIENKTRYILIIV